MHVQKEPLKYHEWMAQNKYWAGKNQEGKSHYQALYREYCKDFWAKQPDPILGYYANGQPIRAAKPGQIATAALIHCTKCKKMICGHGGPGIGAHCVECAKSDGYE